MNRASVKILDELHEASIQITSYYFIATKTKVETNALKG
jgi:hypothetical protein